MFSQRMASLPPRWAARLKALGGNAPGISFSSLRPVPHYPCAVLTTSLPLLLRPSVGNQCFLVQPQHITPYSLCRDTNTPWSSSAASIPPFPPSLPLQLRTQTRGRRNPSLPLHEWGFHSCEVVFPRWYVFYFTQSDSY